MRGLLELGGIAARLLQDVRIRRKNSKDKHLQYDKFQLPTGI
jgi:hypothetical protein